ncbi:hypothetical protein [Parabacteroides sp.]
MRGCQDKHQRNLFERGGARFVTLVGEAPGDTAGKCVPFVPSCFLSAFGYAACGVAESGREAGTDLYRFRVGGAHHN